MIYVMSDLHGCYDAYKAMLEKIQFNDDDILYIVGDIVDRGKHGLRILQDMMLYPNIYPILGNHDYMAYTLLREGFAIDKDHDVSLINENLLERYGHWMNDGGKETIREFQTLSLEEKEDVLEYLSEFTLYEEVHVGHRNFVLVHADLAHFSIDKPLDAYQLNEVLFTRINYDKVYYQDKIIITGHTPTLAIDPMYKGKIYMKNNHIGLDCGCVFGLGLGCLCLDTMETFYVLEGEYERSTTR